MQKRLLAMKKKPLAMQSRLKQITSVVIRKRKLSCLGFGLAKGLAGVWAKTSKKVLTTTTECVIIILTKGKVR